MEPRWLDAREAAAWRGFHALRADLMAHLARDLYVRTGLTEAEYAVLVVLSEAPGGRLRARDTARELRWERSRLSHQVSRMESRGMLRREPCTYDSRGFDLVLTDAGHAAIKAAAPIHLESVRHCFIDLLTSDELATLTAIADRVSTHLAVEHAGDGAIDCPTGADACDRSESGQGTS